MSGCQYSTNQLLTDAQIVLVNDMVQGFWPAAGREKRRESEKFTVYPRLFTPQPVGSELGHQKILLPPVRCIGNQRTQRTAQIDGASADKAMCMVW